MKTTEYNTQQKIIKNIQLREKQLKKTMAKMEKELEKPAINAVFQRLKNK